MATKSQRTFELRYTVTATVGAPPSRVWALLTDAAAFPSWNSTVTSIEGPIEFGRTLAIKVPIAPTRVFRPKVVAFDPERQMVWRDGMLPFFQGTRTFTLTPDGANTHFEMTEVFRGVMLPLIKPSLPDFAPVFDRYAEDLAKACEG